MNLNIKGKSKTSKSIHLRENPSDLRFGDRFLDTAPNA